MMLWATTWDTTDKQGKWKDIQQNCWKERKGKESISLCPSPLLTSLSPCNCWLRALPPSPRTLLFFTAPPPASTQHTCCSIHLSPISRSSILTVSPREASYCQQSVFCVPAKVSLSFNQMRGFATPPPPSAISLSNKSERTNISPPLAFKLPHLLWPPLLLH